jgi:hypothetical protein
MRSASLSSQDTSRKHEREAMRLAVLERRNHLRSVPFTIVSWDASSFARYVSVLRELSKKKDASRSHTSAYWNERRGLFVTEAYLDMPIRRR